MRLIGLVPVTLVFVTAAVLAEEQRPYAGHQHRTIKALAPQEILSLRAGDGMGFASPAELNGYPGPRHVIELAAELQLTPGQLAETEQLFADMQSEAIMLGEEIIQLEKGIDDGFRRGTVNAESLESALREAGAARAKLRHVHLRTHLLQKALLSAEQVATYNELRGYTGGTHRHQKHSSDSEADKSRLRALDQAYANEWKEGDEEGVMALFSADATLVPHHGDAPIKGHDAIREFWFNPAYPPTVVAEWTRDAKEIFVSGDVGVVRGRARLVWEFQGTRTTIPEGNYVLIAMRHDNDWKIRMLTWNDDPREWSQESID